jgi:hypothetical protein
MKQMKTLIIQSSFPRSASTLLVNALYGMTPGLEDKNVMWNDFNHYYNYNYDNDVIVIKNHNVNIDDIIHLFKNKYRLYFICSERRDAGERFESKYHTYKNVAIFDFNDLNETETNPLEHILQTIHSRVSRLISHVAFNRLGGLKRVTEMNERYEEIAHMPFSYVDPLYQIHGSHRSRKKHIRGGRGPQ